MTKLHPSRALSAGAVAIFVALLSSAAEPSAALEVPAFTYNQRRVSSAAVPTDKDSDIFNNDYPDSETSTYAPITRSWSRYARTPYAFLGRPHEWARATTMPRGAGKTFPPLSVAQMEGGQEPIQASVDLGLGNTGKIGAMPPQDGFDELNVQDEQPVEPEQVPEAEAVTQPQGRRSTLRGRLAAVRERMVRWRQSMGSKLRQLGARMRGWVQRRRRGGRGPAEPVDADVALPPDSSA